MSEQRLIDAVMIALQQTSQRTGEWAWQNKAIYAICRALKLLLMNELRKV